MYNNVMYNFSNRFVALKIIGDYITRSMQSMFGVSIARWYLHNIDQQYSLLMYRCEMLQLSLVVNKVYFREPGPLKWTQVPYFASLQTYQLVHLEGL